MLERLEIVRVVSTPQALGDAEFPAELLVMPVAGDEVWVVGTAAFVVPDPHAIVVTDTGWCGEWLDNTSAAALLSRHCAWARPTQRPSIAQGMIAGLPAKLWLTDHRTLVIVPHVHAAEFEERTAA